MKARSSNYYPSAKFSVLTDAESIARAKKNYLTWIIGTLLFIVTAASITYKLFFIPVNINGEIIRSATNETSTVIKHSRNSSLKFYNPTPLLARFIKRNKNKLEFACGESKTQEAIPSIYTEKIFQNYFENVHDYVYFDLLLHYDNIINKYPPKTLKSIFNEYQNELLSVRRSEDFLDFLTVLKSNKFKFYAEQLKQQKYNLQLEQFESYFALTDELNYWYNFLDLLPGFFSSYEEVKLRKYFEGCEEKNFEKFSEETQKRLFRFVYPFRIGEKKLEEINKIASEWARPLNIEFDNCSVIFYNEVVILSDVNDKILDLNVSCLKNVFVFASSKIYLDVDLKLLGVNLAIIAPKWVFLKNIKINLNGHAARNHSNGTSNPFQPGEPGNPGGNAGDFLGVGNFIKKFLLISADGGRGGNAQNGAKGSDGADDTRPGPPVNKPTCALKIKAFNNTFGEVITHYEIYNEAGCGGSGMDGGVGGVGGFGGVITLISKNEVNITNGLNGGDGKPGKGGAGGEGGQNGCFYEVLDVDDEILHPVTTVKCPPGNILPSGKFGKDNENFQGRIFPPEKEKLALHKIFSQFIRLAGSDFKKHRDANLLSFLKYFNQRDLYNELTLTDIVNEYKMLDVFGRTEVYSIFNEKIIKFMQHSNVDQSALKYLNSIVLGKMLILKKNVDFFFIGLQSYLKYLRRNIINTNMNALEINSLLHFKKKIGIKCEQVRLNMEQLRMKLTALYLDTEKYTGNAHPNQTKYLSTIVEERRILCVMISTIDVYFLINRYSSDKKILRQSAFCSFDEVQGNIKSSIANAKYILFKIAESLENEEEIKENFVNLKDLLYLLKESSALSDAGKNLLEALTDELEHFIALYYFTGWEELGNAFSKSLRDLMLSKSLKFEESNELKFLKRQLMDVVMEVQYNLAIRAARQRLYPFVNDSFQLLQEETTASNVLTQIDILEDFASQDFDSFCKNQIKAVFNKDSAVGEFYLWRNSEIKHKLKHLFKGGEISLKANLINHHIFDKNFIQFTSLKLEFECSGNGSLCEKLWNEVFLKFKIEIIHSGYSYYNWQGETHIVVSEKVNLNYSFRMRDDKKPEVYNSLFEKCQNDEIRLSPFTTWSVRLLPLKDDASFTKLTPFTDFVNLRLIGTGTYIS